MSWRVKRLLLTAVLAVIGFLCSGCVTLFTYHMPDERNFEFLAQEVPLPHHVPKYKGGLSFRFAMAHDVIHERFPRHGREHYLERNRRAENRLAELPPDDPERLLLTDDLAVGLDRIGESGRAVDLMRDKLRTQQEQGIAGRDLYTTYANLGTFLIHANFRDAMAQDTEAIERFEEGVGFIRRSVEVNPSAHFGREAWQAAIAEFLLASFKVPELLRQFDCLGNRLDESVESAFTRDMFPSATGYGRPYTVPFGRTSAEREVPAYFETGINPGGEDRWDELQDIRQFITRVGAERGWEDVDVPSHREPAPFDEPMLGIIGMWRQGGGANPHFSLAIAETMLRVGQRYIAWTAFARTKLLANRYSPDPALQQFLIEHCDQRQRDINATIRESAEEAGTARRGPALPIIPPPSPATMGRMQVTFEDELAFGLEYQTAYQEFEARQLAAGVDLDADGFFDEFVNQRGSIGSAVGREEMYRYVSRSRIDAFGRRHALASAILGAGCFAVIPIGFRWLRFLVRSLFAAVFARRIS